MHVKLEDSERITVGLKAQSQSQSQVMLDKHVGQDNATLEATGHILSSTEIEVVTQ